MENFFIELLKLGRIKIENGQIIILNATNILLPTRSFIFLMNILEKKYGKEESRNILKEIGKFQIKQALVRYIKLFEIEKMGKQEFFELGVKIGEILGLGEFELKDNFGICKNNPIAIEYKLMFGECNQPIDFYICGILEEAYKAYLNKEVEVKETKCIACGDPYCQFEVFPVEG
jgi:predicted hydrocarbon binding protein